MQNLTPAILALREQYLQKLGELHDDHAHTRMLWTEFQVRIARYNEAVKFHNPVTGSVVDGTQLAGKAPSSLERLRDRTFKDIVAQVELFVSELLRIWLFANPLLMSEKALNLATLLGSQDLAEAKKAAISEALDSTVDDKMYGRPEKWFNYLKKNVGLHIGQLEEWLFFEMKARRDVLEHHGGLVEITYLDKTKGSPKYGAGDRVRILDYDVDIAYRAILELIIKISGDAIAKSEST